jgi:hypothetical protein
LHFGEKKRNDFFVHNLLGVEPPERNPSRVAAISGGAQ